MFGRLLAKPLQWRNHLAQSADWKKGATAVRQRLRKMGGASHDYMKPGDRWIVDTETAHHDWIRLGAAIVVPIVCWRAYLWNYDSTCGYKDEEGNYMDNFITAWIRRTKIACKQRYWEHQVYQTNKNYERMMLHIENKKQIRYPYNLTDYVEKFATPLQWKADPEKGNEIQYGYVDTSTYGHE